MSDDVQRLQTGNQTYVYVKHLNSREQAIYLPHLPFETSVILSPLLQDATPREQLLE